MDYTTRSLGFKITKVLRYVRLYGVSRTWTKVRAQKHMKKRYADLPVSPGASGGAGHVGIIGCGTFGYSTIAYFLRRNYGKVIRACMDVDIHRAASLWEAYGLHYYTDDASEIIDDPAIDLVFIASNHASHAEYAIRALRAGKAVHIEKPHCVSEDQLRRLCDAMRETGGKVELGFNRPASRFGELLKAHLDAQTGPAMFNWFIAGHRIDPEHWYFKDEEGGRILGNLCHWTDFVFQMVNPEKRFPIEIVPTCAEQSDANVAVAFCFGDDSIAALTFSAKGHTFEGVRERFAAHKGDLLASLDDFKTLTIEVVEQKRTYRARHRDHGHERRVRQSYAMVAEGAPGAAVSYVWETGMLVLKTDEALRTRSSVVLQAYEASFAKEAAGV
jgi:predicted dehydrogenase